MTKRELIKKDEGMRKMIHSLQQIIKRQEIEIHNLQQQNKQQTKLTK